MVWYIENPTLLQDELARLAEYDLEYELDKNAQASGRIIITVTFPIDGKVLFLKCYFPDDYPYFPFEIACNEFPSGRHLEPSSKLICLFLDKHNSWNISSDMLADIIVNRIAEIYRIHMNPDQNSEAEDSEDGYQISGQFQVEPNSAVLLNIDQDIQSEKGEGSLKIRPNFQKEGRFLGSLFSLRDSTDKTIYTDSSDLNHRFEKKIPLRWVQLNSHPTVTDPDGLLKLILTEYPHLKTPRYTEIDKLRFEIVGVCFPEETSRGQIEMNWVFILRCRNNGKKSPSICKLIRSEHIHPKHSLSRTPRLLGLADKTIALIGTGALGATVAMQLARAGVKRLRLVDQDFLQAGNLSRWAPALPYIGCAKVLALQSLLKTNYLDMDIKPYQFEIGNPFHDFSSLLNNQVLLDCDLVVDCTAQLNVNQYLSQLCHKKGIDYIWCSATNGAWGGIVGKYLKDDVSNVWLEFNSLYGNGRIEPAAAEKTNQVQPKGCFHPTFTGAGVDLDSVSILASRLAISVLQQDLYGTFDFDVAVLDQWNETGPSLPTWREYRFNNEESLDTSHITQ